MLQWKATSHVRYGSLADIAEPTDLVCFVPQADIHNEMWVRQ
jgi:hypothetical protein